MTTSSFKSALEASALLVFAAVGLAGCTTTMGSQSSLATPPPVTPTEQYALQAQTMTKTINLRLNPNGLSTNQRAALDQVADRANWVNGEAVDVEIVTSADPGAVAAGGSVASYLRGRDVAEASLSQLSAQQQPADIITINMIYYRAKVHDCNQSWENLTQTFNNAPYNNFGCALTSNLAAQIADPRDLDGPRQATPGDPERKATIIGKYQKGEVTSAIPDSASNATISQAIQ